MTNPRMLNIPEECRVVFGMFAEAVVEKAREAGEVGDDPQRQEALLNDFVKSFEILLKHSNEEMLRLLSESDVQDLVYTLICYLDANIRDSVAGYLASNPQQRLQITQTFKLIQNGLKEAIREEIRKGNRPVAQALGKSA